MNDSKQSYQEYREELKANQEKKPYDEVKEEMERKSKYVVELDNLKPQEHHWVDRGVVMSCEGAMHPNHRAFKRRR